MKYKILIILMMTLSLFAKNNAFNSQEILSGLNSIWGMTFLNENKLLLTQKNGEIFSYNINTKKLKKVFTVKNVLNKGQGGLLDIKSSPTYKKDFFVYITYVKNIDNYGATTLARFVYKNNRLSDFKDLLVSKSRTNTSYHFGSRITFDENNHIYFTTGDRGLRNSAQDLTNHAGSVLRLNIDGSIPNTNPFIDSKNKLDEIYSFGHRNPQGIFYDKLSKNIYSIEHGPRGGDEINIIKKAKNYGWPIISFGKEYHIEKAVGEAKYKIGMENPIKVYIPSIAPSSLIVYSGKLYKKYKGHIFAGALKLRHLNEIVLDKNPKTNKEYRHITNLNQRVRNIVESPKGKLYISTDSGKIYELIPKKNN